MASGIHALTEKEKETLRLLVSGYDAKSMARHLGLSVHTINERLRDARRKMATSSSREAARLLRAHESRTPELLGDKRLGDAPPPAAMGQSFHQAESPGRLRRAGWIIGGLFMTFSLALLALSALSGPAQAPATAAALTAAAPAPTSASEQAAIGAARQFLTLLDRDNWAASWQATHQSFKLLNTADWWGATSVQMRGRFGAVQTRDLMTVDFTPAPPHGQWTVRFKARYAKQADATETLSLAWEDSNWKVVSILIE